MWHVVHSLIENMELTSAVTSWNTTDQMMSQSLSVMDKLSRTEIIMYVNLMTHLLTKAITGCLSDGFFLSSHPKQCDMEYLSYMSAMTVECMHK